MNSLSLPLLEWPQYARDPHDSIPGEKGGENRYVNLLEALI